MIEFIENSPEDWRTTLKGDQGISAYQVAVQRGFIGTQDEWLDSLKLKYEDLTEAEKEDLRGPNIWRD